VRQLGYITDILRGKKPWLKCIRGRVLDAGCGEGDFLAAFPNSVGIDINLGHLKKAKTKNRNVVLASVTHIPFKSESIDCIYSHDVIEHLDVNSAYEMFLEFQRVLKKGGCIVLRTQMATPKIWNTFSHVKPYPASAIKKLLSTEHMETFSPLKTLNIKEVYYFGKYSKIKILRYLYSFIAHFLKVGRISYAMVIRKEGES